MGWYLNLKPLRHGAVWQYLWAVTLFHEYCQMICIIFIMIIPMLRSGGELYEWDRL
jgi:hypothetical protein